MKSRILVLSISSVLFLSLQFSSSCKKINEGTTIGDDLIPIVDNVTTFDTTLTVQAYNGVFTDLEDSTRITAAAEHFIGRISNDPLFGKTDASLFLQLKPTFFPYAFHPKSDSMTDMKIDSVVLVLSYAETYGDTNTAQTFRVYEMDNTNNFNADSFYLIRSNTFTYSNSLTSQPVTIIPRNLDDSTKPLEELAKNQVRIKLDNLFGARLLSYDSLQGGAYHDDSTFNTKFNGFAIVPDMSNNGNAIIGVNLLDTNTKLAIYYRWFKNGGTTPYDTTVRYFRFTGSSAQASQITRDYAGNNPQIQTYLSNSPTSPDDLVFLQNTPGTYAKLKIPDLGGLSNRVVHRAELIAEQVYDPSDDKFAPPQFLFLDAYDPAKAKYRTIPYDFIINSITGATNALEFGMAGKSEVLNGNPIHTWHFNITRYVQHIVTNHEPNYELRIFAPNYVKDIYSGDPLGSSPQFNVNPTVAKGRVRVGGGNNPAQKMRLRIIYSKI